jgi:hypothetical protein
MMIPAIAGTVLLALGWQADGAEVESSTAIVPDGSNAVLTVANFVRIQGFIIAQGKRRTYCNMYGNNPYWAFPGFNGYLNPPDQSNINCEIGKSEFNTLVIQVMQPRTTYWNVLLGENGKELRVRKYYSKTDPHVLVQEATEFFREALAEIDRRTKQGEIGKREPAAGK